MVGEWEQMCREVYKPTVSHVSEPDLRSACALVQAAWEDCTEITVTMRPTAPRARYVKYGVLDIISMPSQNSSGIESAESIVAESSRVQLLTLYERTHIQFSQFHEAVLLLSAVLLKNISS